MSKETAEALAEAMRVWMGADIGLAETGIAGPSGGSAERPEGSGWIAAATPRGITSRRCQFDGDRAENQRAIAEALLALALDAVAGYGE